MTDDDPPLLIYQQTADHLLLNPRPGPRHALRAEPYPRRPAHAMPEPTSDQPTFTTEDGDTYQRVDPAEFDDCDDVDSTTVTDDGAPAVATPGGEH